jgi:hypothetical protein
MGTVMKILPLIFHRLNMRKNCVGCICIAAGLSERG